MAPWGDVLTPNEKIVVDVLQSHGPALARDLLLEQCRIRGMDEVMFDELTSHSPILRAHDASRYTIAGTSLPEATPEELAAAPAGDVSPDVEHGFLSEGQVYLTWKLRASALKSGALRMPEPINTFAEGDYKLKTVANRELGVLYIRQRACWDVRRLLLALGGEVDDTLAIVLDLREHTATGILGYDDVAARVASGWAELAAANAARLAKDRSASGSAPTLRLVERSDGDA
jgi:hypothetical protein